MRPPTSKTVDHLPKQSGMLRLTHPHMQMASRKIERILGLMRFGLPRLNRKGRMLVACADLTTYVEARFSNGELRIFGTAQFADAEWLSYALP